MQTVRSRSLFLVVLIAFLGLGWALGAEAIVLNIGGVGVHVAPVIPYTEISALFFVMLAILILGSRLWFWEMRLRRAKFVAFTNLTVVLVGVAAFPVIFTLRVFQELEEPYPNVSVHYLNVAVIFAIVVICYVLLGAVRGLLLGLIVYVVLYGGLMLEIEQRLKFWPLLTFRYEYQHVFWIQLTFAVLVVLVSFILYVSRAGVPRGALD